MEFILFVVLAGLIFVMVNLFYYMVTDATHPFDLTLKLLLPSTGSEAVEFYSERLAVAMQDMKERETRNAAIKAITDRLYNVVRDGS